MTTPRNGTREGTSATAHPDAPPDRRVEGFAYWAAWSLFFVGFAFAAGLRAVVPLETLQRFPGGVNIYLFLTQDLVWLGITAALLPIAWTLATRGFPSAPRPRFTSDRRAVLAIVVVFAATAALGVETVHHRYALSLDEFLARFQARALLSGHLFAPIRAGWQDFARALQPVFMRYDLEAGVWGPGYRHGNALMLAAFGAAGWMPWTHVVTGSLALVVFGRLCRKLWPDRPWVAAAGVFLLASSPQVWVTAMTSYAMTPHLLLTLVWVALYSRDDMKGHLGALAIAPLAIGLHQFHIHPLIALPFLSWLVVDRRWKLAAVYAAWYSVWVLVWIMWRDLLIDTASARGTGPEATFVLARVIRLWVASRSPVDVIFAAVNFFRFLAWQNIALAPLVLVGLHYMRSAPRMVRAGVWSTVLLLVPHLMLMPSQGHGWGYRYLHPALGFLVLLGLHGAVRVSRRAGWDGAPVFTRALAALALASLIAIPLRAVQVESFVRPFAAASARIEQSTAEVVVVDDQALWFGVDLVRNDPLLDHPPFVMAGGVLSEVQARELCQERSVEIVGPTELEHLGMTTLPKGPASLPTALVRCAISGPGSRLESAKQ